MNMNPMMLMQTLNQFRQQINGDPEQMVKQMVNSGQVSQTQLNEAQRQASEIMKLISK